jgi:hypothetical protein
MTSSSCNPWFSLIKFKNDLPKHKTLIMMSWKLEFRNSLREHKLLSSSTSKLDRCIMFLMVQRSMEIINNLESSHRFIVLNNFWVPGDKSVEPQEDILDDDFLLWSLSLKLMMTLGMPLLGMYSISSLLFSACRWWCWLEYLMQFSSCLCRRLSRMTTRMFSVQLKSFFVLVLFPLGHGKPFFLLMNLWC